MTQALEKNLRVVEAMLFASPEPVTMPALQARLPEEVVAQLPEILAELKAQYESRGVNLVEREGRWTFRTAPDLADALVLEREVPKKLSRACIETLAIIAYHQPVTRPEIESIRGVAINRGTLDLLLETGWIKIGRRREVPGRPVTWVTTPAFLDHFGISSLDDLPGIEELKAAGLLDKRPAIETIPRTADMFESEAKEEEVSGEENDFDFREDREEEE